MDDYAGFGFPASVCSTTPCNFVAFLERHVDSPVIGFQMPPGGLEEFVKPDGYLNQQGAICARSSYWLQIVVGLHRCDAGGRFARCVVVIRIGV